MKKIILMLTLALAICVSAVSLTSCGKKDDTDYEHLRDVSWDGTELTIKLGENQTSGCKWTTKPEDDKVIDYSTKRVFHLADATATDGDAVGTLEAGFTGKGAGTSRIICTTPVGWDGSGEGLTYIVTVTVKEDGTIEDAKGEESKEVPAETADGSGAGTDEKDGGSSGSKAKNMTLEEYFKENPQDLKDMKQKLKQQTNGSDEVSSVMDIDMDVKGNTMFYIYKFKQTYTAEQLKQIKPALKKSTKGSAAESLKNTISLMETGFGVKGIKIRVVYRNGNGKKIIASTIK